MHHNSFEESRRSSLEAFILIVSIVALLNMIIERVSKIKGVQRNKDVYIFFTIASRVRKRERKSESEEDKFAQRFCLLELFIHLLKVLKLFNYFMKYARLQTYNFWKAFLKNVPAGTPRSYYIY